MTPLSVEIVPWPVFRSPCHWADALRFIVNPPSDHYPLRADERVEGLSSRAEAAAAQALRERTR
jgi:hypothetical protein